MIDIVEGNIASIRELCAKHNVRKLSVFGSATDDSFDPARSDVDVLVDFGKMPPGKHAEHYMALARELEELFGLHVDLVEVGAIRNRYFMDAVQRSAAVVYDAA